jgi:hypothetical protein
MRKTSDDLLWVAVDAVSAGLADGAKASAEAEVKILEAVRKDPVWGELAAQRGRLQALLKSAQGAKADIIRRNLASLDRLEAVRHLKIAKASGELRDLIGIHKDLDDKIKEARGLPESEKPTIDAVVYETALISGQVAGVFLKDCVRSKAVPIAGWAASGLEAVGLMTNLYEENRRMTTLSTGSYDRHQKRLELDDTMRELEEERARLEAAVGRSQPS